MTRLALRHELEKDARFWTGGGPPERTGIVAACPGGYRWHMTTAGHWDAVYNTKRADEVSWFQRQPETSVRLLAQFSDPAGSVVDVGAGESLLADALLDAGWTDVTVLDVSREAVAVVAARLSERAGVSFIVADLLEWQPNRLYDAWHDIANLDRLDDADLGPFDVVGPICESSDLFGKHRPLPRATAPGDLMLVADAGAYGSSMASEYNLRALPVEDLLEEGTME